MAFLLVAGSLLGNPGFLLYFFTPIPYAAIMVYWYTKKTIVWNVCLLAWMLACFVRYVSFLFEFVELTWEAYRFVGLGCVECREDYHMYRMYIGIMVPLIVIMAVCSIIQTIDTLLK